MKVTRRENLVLRTSEHWQPPPFTPGRRGRVLAWTRRLVDLQAASLWRDLRPTLSGLSGRLVDVGCGAQPYRHLLSKRADYVGLDTGRADADFGYAIPGVRLFGDDNHWPVADGEADVVLATETLEHVPDPPTFLAEAFRCLKPGGRVIITVPFSARWHYIPYDYWRFTPSGLRVLLEQAGFGDIVVHGRGNEGTVACYKLLGTALSFATSQATPGAIRLRPGAVLAAPVIAVLALMGQVAMRGRAGDDCLGYTAYARRRSDSEGPDAMQAPAGGTAAAAADLPASMPQTVRSRRSET
jgi:SAM-dependent methyltransferase